MAAIPSSAFVPKSTSSAFRGHEQQLLPRLSQRQRHLNPTSKQRTNFTVKAAKLPAGVEVPKVEPKFKPPFVGFTKTAEIWNSRACMMGLIGTFIVELILNKGILQMIGVEVGKGLDIPL